MLHDAAGSLDDPPVVAACVALARAGVGALRFSFRAAGLDAALAEAAGAIRLLRAHPAVPARAGAVGFGFGGAVAAIAAGRDSRLRVAVLVGAPAQVGESRRPLAEVTRTRARVLVLRAEDDIGVSSLEAERYTAVLSQARVTHRLVTVPGADRAFLLARHREQMLAALTDWVRESFATSAG